MPGPLSAPQPPSRTPLDSVQTLLALCGAPQDWDGGTDGGTAGFGTHSYMNPKVTCWVQSSCAQQLLHTRLCECRLRSPRRARRVGRKLFPPQPAAVCPGLADLSTPLPRGSGLARPPCARLRHWAPRAPHSIINTVAAAPRSRTPASWGAPFLPKMAVCNAPRERRETSRNSKE